MGMMMNIFLVVFLCLLSQLPHLSLSEPTGKKCSTDSNTCTCKTDQGTIDLTAIATEPGASPPRFSNVPDSGDFSYNYNPCVSFSDPRGECAQGEVYACQSHNTNPTDSYAIAQAGTEAMYIDTDGKVYVYYTGTGGRETRVDLQCDSKAEPQGLGLSTTGDSETPLLYKFVLKGCQVCVGGCSGSVGPHQSKAGVAVGEVGVVLILLIPVALIAYFIIGAVVMKVKYNAAGSDLIPNKIFWVALPGLIKEGFVCTFGPPIRFIRAKIRGNEGYEEQKDSV